MGLDSHKRRASEGYGVDIVLIFTRRGAPFRSQTTNVLEGTGFADYGRSDGFPAADDFHRFVADNDGADEGAQISLRAGVSPLSSKSVMSVLNAAILSESMAADGDACAAAWS